MKSVIILIVLACSFSIASAKENKDVRTLQSFIDTCPEKFLTYIDKSEGGPGAYCACPEENINYLDKSEGGPGFYCSEN